VLLRLGLEFDQSLRHLLLDRTDALVVRVQLRLRFLFASEEVLDPLLKGGARAHGDGDGGRQAGRHMDGGLVDTNDPTTRPSEGASESINDPPDREPEPARRTLRVRQEVGTADEEDPPSSRTAPAT
jgi:hypothetical protein